MTPLDLYRSAILPAAVLLPAMDSPAARLMLLTIALQESSLTARIQTPVGFARSYWQMERGGGVQAALMSNVTRAQATVVCAALDVPGGLDTVFEAIAWNDILACCLARLFLYQSPLALPALTDADAAWTMYQSTWRPGKPAPERWAANHAWALAVVTA